MKIGATAGAAILMIVVGLPLYSIADVEAGAYLATAGVLLALAATIAANRWAWRHDEDDFR